MYSAYMFESYLACRIDPKVQKLCLCHAEAVCKKYRFQKVNNFALFRQSNDLE